MHATLLGQSIQSTDPQRIYRRDWKLNKPHLPKSTSLPVLQLAPANRPIFLCRQCGFINTLIPLCLWCRWTSKEAHQEFESSMPRVRRATAPSRVYWKRVAAQEKITTIFPGAYHKGPSPHNMLPDFLHSGDKVTLSTSPTPTFDKSRETGLLEKVHLPPLPPDELYECVSKDTDGPPNALQSLKTMSTKSLRSPHLIIDLKAAHNAYEIAKPAVIPSPVRDCSQTSVSTKTLRRKKRFTALLSTTGKAQTPVMSSPNPTSPPRSPILKSAQAAAYLDHDTYSIASTPYDPPDRPTHGRSNSQPVNGITRLGHPNRPYYTAIRPNRSRPTSVELLPTRGTQAQAPVPIPYARPVSLPSPRRPPSPGIYSVLSFTSVPTGSIEFEDDDGQSEEAAAPRSSFSGLFSASVSAPRERAGVPPVNQNLPLGGLLTAQCHRSGFSVSGETELRMALARGQVAGLGADDVGVLGAGRHSFQFRDMPKHETKVRRKVNEWKRGFKQLVMAKREGLNLG